MSGDWEIELRLTNNNPVPSDDWIPVPGDIFHTVIYLGRFTESESISPGSEYTSTLNVDIPLTYRPVLSMYEKQLEGYFYLRINVDPLHLISEANESNNNFTNPYPVHVSQPPDLSPIAVSGTSTADVGSQVTATAVICNHGNGYAWSWNGWITGIYLQNNTSTILIERFSESREYEPSSCYESTRTVTLPQDIPPGTYHWRIIVDEQNQVEEINKWGTAEMNNESNGSIIEILPVVDLAPMTVIGPENAIQGSTISVDWSITNQGTGEDLNTWILQLVISPDDEINSSDNVLLNKSVPPVASGSVISWTDEVDVSVNTGTYYLGIIVDATNTVQERDETNNVLASSTALIILPQPDLIPTSVQGPNQARTGDNITVSTDVANQGTGAAPAGWTRQTYLSSDEIISEEDQLLGMVSATSPLNPGGTISSQDNIVIPDTTPVGNYYLGVILVATFPETDTSNNSIASSRDIRIR